MMSWIFRHHLMELNRGIEVKIEAGQFKGVTYLLWSLPVCISWSCPYIGFLSATAA